MATSQKTWDVSSVPGAKELAGGPQQVGGDANPTPNVAASSWKSMRSMGMESAGWCSPNEASESQKKL